MQPTDEDLEWQTEAKCKTLGPVEARMFFPLEGEGMEVVRAKMFCSDCRVRIACVGFALDFGIEHGIWGGYTPTERDLLLRRSG